MASMDEKILAELKEISLYMGDLNAIRNGEYEPPRGAGARGVLQNPTYPHETHQLIAAVLRSLEHQNELLDQLGIAIAGEKKWDTIKAEY